jgi:predicted RNA-binding protein with RPS1 domain
MFLALEKGASLLVSIKEIPLERVERINEELSVYREVD